MNNKLKIVSIASEIHPFSKTGGLADVARSLPKALKRLGHEVIVITPFYGAVIDKKKYKLKLLFKDVKIKVDKENNIKVNFWQGYLMEDLPIYFMENEKYFSRYRRLYGSRHENARFLLFNIASLKLLSLLKFEADIIQCHDWHTGLIPELLKKNFKQSSTLKNAATVFTIHNLAFQSGHDWWTIPNGQKDDGHKKLLDFDDPKLKNINFAKRGILHADIINTVSEKYAKEILTRDFGQDLQVILQNRKNRLFGIVNGIDYLEYNPLTDPGLYKNFSYKSSERKIHNKLYIQRYFKLPQKEKTPLISMVSRITEQKGFDLIKEIIEGILHYDIQFIIMGDGDKKYIQFFNKIAKKNPKKFIMTPFNRKKETSIFAGSDISFLPSRFEPCGLPQMISLRYGCIPIVRSIGGLADTIEDFNPQTQKGNGFIFKRYDRRDLLIAIGRALQEYKHEKSWKKLVQKGMQQSFSWEIPAQKYVILFKKAIRNKKKK